MAESPTKKDIGVGEGRKGSTVQDIDVAIQEAPASVLQEGSLDPVYEAKAKILNKAIQDIGMGKYQWQVCSCSKSFPML